MTCAVCDASSMILYNNTVRVLYRMFAVIQVALRCCLFSRSVAYFTRGQILFLYAYLRLGECLSTLATFSSQRHQAVYLQCSRRAQEDPGTV